MTTPEDALLNNLKLRSNMPEGWAFGENLLARYSLAKIELLPPGSLKS